MANYDSKQILNTVFNDGTNAINVLVENTSMPSVLDTAVRDTTALQVDIVNTSVPTLDSNMALAMDSTTGTIKVIITDLSGRQARIDNVAGSLGVISYEHHEIHEGDTFEYSNGGILASGAYRSYLIRTPNTTKWAHIFFNVNSSAKGHYALHEDCTATATGSIQIAYNRNRNSDTSNTTSIYLTPTTTGNGNRLIVEYFGAKQSAGTIRSSDEFILKQNTDYFLEIISDENTNNISEMLNWYEHTNTY